MDLVPGRRRAPPGRPPTSSPDHGHPSPTSWASTSTGSTPTPSPTLRPPTGAALCSSSRRAGSHPSSSASIAEELASHGYVVVGVNHTYETAVTVFSDGRVAAMNPAALGGALGPQIGPHEAAFRRRAEVCNYKAADLRFVADHLSRLGPNRAGLTGGHLDLTSVGAFGHSFGGNAALEWCRADERCRASANLDGAIWTEVGTVGLPRPALQILADHPEFALTGADAVAAGIVTDPAWHDAERMLARDGWRNVDRLASPGHTARIAGSTHMSFMDIPFLAVQPGSPVAGMLAATSIRPERMWRLTSDLLLAFFAEHLDGFSDPVRWIPRHRPTRGLHRPTVTGAHDVIHLHSGSTCAQPVHRAGHTFVRPPGGDAVAGAEQAMRTGLRTR